MADREGLRPQRRPPELPLGLGLCSSIMHACVQFAVGQKVHGQLRPA